jgi:hypothetical protein
MRRKEISRGRARPISWPAMLSRMVRRILPIVPYEGAVFSPGIAYAASAVAPFMIVARAQ